MDKQECLKKRWRNEPAADVWSAAFLLTHAKQCVCACVCDHALELSLLEAADESRSIDAQRMWLKEMQ